MAEMNVNGIKISYSTYGKKENPAIILTHGLTADKSHWSEIANQLADTYFVITYDCRGHGKTDKPANYNLEDLAEDLITIIDQLGYTKIAAAGCSMGGMITLKAASMKPELFHKLILIVTTARVGKSVQDNMFKAYNIDDPSTVTQEELMRLAGEAVWCPDTPVEKRVLQKYEPLTSEQQIAANRAISNFDIREDIRKISCPTLVLSGKWDKLIPPEYGKEIAEFIPNAELYIYENSGHRLMGEETPRLVKQMRDFLK